MDRLTQQAKLERRTLMANIYLDDEPAHKRFGFGALWIGEEVEIDLDEMSVRAVTLRSYVHAHATYHGKKFKTRTINSSMFIKRTK